MSCSVAKTCFPGHCAYLLIKREPVHFPYMAVFILLKCCPKTDFKNSPFNTMLTIFYSSPGTGNVTTSGIEDAIFQKHEKTEPYFDSAQDGPVQLSVTFNEISLWVIRLTLVRKSWCNLNSSLNLAPDATPHAFCRSNWGVLLFWYISWFYFPLSAKPKHLRTRRLLSASSCATLCLFIFIFLQGRISLDWCCRGELNNAITRWWKRPEYFPPNLVLAAHTQGKGGILLVVVWLTHNPIREQARPGSTEIWWQALRSPVLFVLCDTPLPPLPPLCRPAL